MFNFKNLHVGLTNRCRLLCPECARTSLGGRYIQNMFDLDTEYFKKFLLEAQPERILFCGNWGDPIYSKDLVELMRVLKENNPILEIMIHTNGSGKSTEWWESLMSVMNEHDYLIFSIDGTPENFNKYRINAKWDDVENAAKTCIAYKKATGNGPKIGWKHLVFSYNQDTLKTSYALSKVMDFDFFFLQHSLVEEGNGNDWLATTKPFNEIEEEFNDYKNKSLL
jgi:MoaA/NifB/PqqE/SkfB family radical SAM enzyme